MSQPMSQGLSIEECDERDNIDMTPASAFEPDFVFPLENVTIAQGRDATFTCVVNNLGGYRTDNVVILDGDAQAHAQNYRMKAP
ncbi:hypothetical protein Bhyg_03908 [Pseudolycoriella hygida]|uniref:Ig-like domain-containing protein n=1 Tax=Pseudolycoriella hygida TaxID=35572 RepID=A0A9Q0NE87_9DIPT|nr:hypothetical protein Bhyg_03908 [Pseudolycoriella hygida]